HENITNNSADISYKTNELADGQIFYGLSADNLDQSTDLNQSLSTVHSFSLINLIKGTKYYYKAISKDSSNNSGESDIYYFTTTADNEFAIISNVSVTNITSNQATITWTTNEETDSFVDFGTSTSYGTIGGIYESGTIHSVLLTNLTPETKYYFKALSRDTGNNLTTWEDLNNNFFTTLVDPNDHLPPTIDQVQQATLTHNSITITWTTNENANPAVFYGTSTTYGYYQGKEGLGQDHSIVIGGLSPLTTYYFKIQSKDLAGNEAQKTSNDYVFTTVNEPVCQTSCPTCSTCGGCSCQTCPVIADSLKEISNKLDNEELIKLNNLLKEKSFDEIKNLVNLPIKQEEVSQLTDILKEKSFDEIKILIGLPMNKEEMLELKDLLNKVSFSELKSLSNLLKQIQEERLNIDEIKNALEKILTSLSKDEIERLAEFLSKLSEEQKSQLLTSLTNLNQEKNIDMQDIIQDLEKFSQFTPPTIMGMGPKIENIGVSSAIISWVTNKKANSLAMLEDANGQKTEIGQSDELVNEHKVVINNLNPNSMYVFQIKSKDQYGNIALSKQDKFITKIEPKISEVLISNIGFNQAVITWQSSLPINTFVDYAEDMSYNLTKSFAPDQYTIAHNIKLSDLKMNTKYNFKVKGYDEDGNMIVSDNYIFRTFTLPIISEIKTTNIGYNNFTILWQTNTDADSEVEYIQSSTNEKQISGKPDLTKSHKINITGAESNSTYSVRVKSKDQYGNLAEGKIVEVKVLVDDVAPIISVVRSKSYLIGLEKKKVQTIISWQTDELTNSEVFYDISAQKLEQTSTSTATSSQFIKDDNLTTKHIIILSELKPTVIYYFKVKNIDKYNNESFSQIYTFLTPKEKVSVLRVIIEQLTDIFGWTGMF
ncbi:fibronectin type III domain-containing protein, partial [Patescibacteria group bacterium]|nr:fibronectin type III domain-containing protein [Patescibacteria group bacterium]